jgi:hypothetical protein
MPGRHVNIPIKNYAILNSRCNVLRTKEKPKDNDEHAVLALLAARNLTWPTFQWQ